MADCTGTTPAAQAVTIVFPDQRGWRERMAAFVANNVEQVRLGKEHAAAETALMALPKIEVPKPACLTVVGPPVVIQRGDEITRFKGLAKTYGRRESISEEADLTLAQKVDMLAALDGWEAAVEVEEARIGLPAAKQLERDTDAVWIKAQGMEEEAVHDLLAYQPVDLAELAAKAAFFDARDKRFDALEESVSTALAADVMRLARDGFDPDGEIARLNAERAALEAKVDADYDAAQRGERERIAQADPTIDEIIKLEDAIMATPARSLTGFRIKAELATAHGAKEAEETDDYGVVMMRALTADLVQRSPVASPDAELLALGEELECRWVEEHALENDRHAPEERLLAACDYTGLIAHQIAAMTARTAEGWRVKARAVAWAHSDPTGELADMADTGTRSQFELAFLRQLLGTPEPNRSLKPWRLGAESAAYIEQRMAARDQPAPALMAAE